MRTLPLLLGVVLVGLASCGRPKAAEDRGPPNDTYHVRGRVEKVPTPGDRLSDLVIRHEPIPDFKNPNGTLGMPEMSMPFPVEKGALLEGIEPGDKIEFDLAVWTTPGKRGYEARNIRELPADTPLKLTETAPR